MDTLKDRALLELVKKHLLQDQRLANQSLWVSTSCGYVQISGYIESEELRAIAMDLARGVVGVRDVEDQMIVKVRA